MPDEQLLLHHIKEVLATMFKKDDKVTCISNEFKSAPPANHPELWKDYTVEETTNINGVQHLILAEIPTKQANAQGVILEYYWRAVLFELKKVAAKKESGMQPFEKTKRAYTKKGE